MVAARWKVERVAELFEQRQHPGLAGDGGGAFSPPRQARLEGLPISERIGKRRLNLVAEPAVEAEIAWALALHLPRRRRDLFDEIGRDEPAFDRDRHMAISRSP